MKIHHSNSSQQRHELPSPFRRSMSVDRSPGNASQSSSHITASSAASWAPFHHFELLANLSNWVVGWTASYMGLQPCRGPTDCSNDSEAAWDLQLGLRPIHHPEVRVSWAAISGHSFDQTTQIDGNAADECPNNSDRWSCTSSCEDIHQHINYFQQGSFCGLWIVMNRPNRWCMLCWNVVIVYLSWMLYRSLVVVG